MDNVASKESEKADPSSVLISYTDALLPPPTCNVADSLSRAGFNHLTLHAPPNSYLAEDKVDYAVRRFVNSSFPRSFRPIQQIWNWKRFRSCVRLALSERKPKVVITIMLHALAALPRSKRDFLHVACIYDIPPIEDAGRYDSMLIRQGWLRLRQADIVWASDVFKAQLAQQIGNLSNLPMVCHNCPRMDYLPEPTWPRDPWLRRELQRQGASLGETAGCIILRAGAIGGCGGIEETLAALRSLPEDYIFLMMGRPDSSYKAHLVSLINRNGLEKRAFIWDRPDTETWKRALQGADIGHLIHGPFMEARDQEIYKLNSSLSNNRLFQYMAAALPVLAYDDPRMVDLYEEARCFRVARLTSLEQDITRHLTDLGGSEPLRRQLGESGRQAHLKIYNWQHQFAPVMDRLGGLNQ
jgi:glycosyltransferase involved in cell wall biosynthesis